MSIAGWAARALARRACGRTSVILAYHGVGDGRDSQDQAFLRLPQRAFEAQVDLLLEAGFQIVTVAEFVRRMDGGAPPRGLAALSFDDGMDDNHSTVLPLLARRGVAATVYVTSGFVGRPNPWLDAALASRMMTEDELRGLVQAGFELGAHTVSHPDLAQMSFDECLDEMVRSREEVARIAGTPVSTFAYPFCTYGAAAVSAAEAAGFDAAVTCANRGGWERFELQRVSISGKQGLPTFLLKLNGLYYPLFESRAGRVLRGATRALRRRARAARGR